MPILQKIYTRLFTFLLATMLGSSLLFGQSVEMRTHAYGFEDGLSHRNVFKVLQDTSGFLWVATADGLNRFDGYDFLPWKKDNKTTHLPGQQVRDFCISPSNLLYLACDGKVAIFDPFKNKMDTLVQDPLSPVYKKNHHLSNILLDSKGTVWAIVSLPNDSLVWLQKSDDEGVLRNLARLPGKYEDRPLAEMGGRVWVGAFENELWVFGLDGKQLEQREFSAPRQDKAFSRVVSLQATKDGSLWALLNHGQIWYLPPNGKNFIRHRVSELAPDHFHSSAFLIEENGNVWMSGVVAAEDQEGGSPCSGIQPGLALLRYSVVNKTLEDLSFYLREAMQFAVPPRQIFRDRTGTVWVPTEWGLVQVIENDLFVNYLSEGNDCCRDGVCSIRGIAEDEKGNIYISYYSSVHVLNPANGSLTPLFYPEVKTLGFPFGILCHDGALWTGEGLRIDLKTLKIDTVANVVGGAEGVVMADREGDIWFGCNENLCYLDPKTGRSGDFVDKSGLFSKANFRNITFLYQGNKGGFIWVATREAGIFKILKNKGVVAHYSTKSNPALTHDRVLGMVESGGYLWAATANGLNRIDLKTGEIYPYSTQDGLPHNFINGVLAESASVIWVSTDNGLSRLEVGTGTFTNFFDTDGLTKNEFNRISFFKSHDGRMYFGGINGVNAFYPDGRFAKRPGKTNSRLLLTGFSKFDGDKDVSKTWGLRNGEAMELSYRDQIFTFHFSLSDYADPKLHLYSYFLDGYDKEWSKPSPINFARYFNIPAGKYMLRVQASRGGEDWVDDQLAIPIYIRQAFYKSGWFRTLMLVLLSLVIFAVLRYRLYLARRHEHQLEGLVQVRTSELESEKKKSEDLLLNILPAETAEELKVFGSAKARRHNDVTVLFSDFAGFTVLAGVMEPEDLVAEIDFCFRAFDEIIELHGLEKIKTVGDAYLCVGGMRSGKPDENAVQVVKAALEIQAFLTAIAVERKERNHPYFEARIGIHTGSVVAGIVGIKKFAYDIWGDTVNISERLQSNGEIGKVNISTDTYRLVKEAFVCTPRGFIQAKHKGEVEMFFVEKLKELNLAGVVEPLPKFG